MKKLLFILFLIPVVGFAQPNFVKINPSMDSSTAYYFKYPIPNWQKTGNQNWDFSTLPKNFYDTATHIFLDPVNTPFAADFPNSDLCLYQYLPSSNVKLFWYLKNSNDSLYALGVRNLVNPISNMDYTDPAVLFAFPFVYNQVQKDTWYNTALYGDSSMHKYVAWGNLKTPLGDFSNVILIENYRFFVQTQSWGVSGWYWYPVGDYNALGSISVGDTNGAWVRNHNATNIAQEQFISKYHFEVYPNPASTISYIDFNLLENSEVSLQLISVDGKTNQKIISKKLNTGSHHIPISTHEFPNGTYFIRLVINDKPIVKTLTIDN